MTRALLSAAVAVCVAALAAGPARAGSGAGGLGSPAPVHHRGRDRARAHRHDRTTAHTRHRPAAMALHGRAMWIWELSAVDHGDVADIIAGARHYRITTLVIKSSDGIEPWSQFSPALVSALHHAGLRVCAWQYVYGNHPGIEANLGAQAVHDGADCLVIDAETQYQGKYVAAAAYIHDLREQIGARYPVALAGFPYVDYHPSFPYSVFLGPGGAQYDVPQMYWRAIGTSVNAVFAHTYAFNLPYGRAIYPLGQVYGNPPPRQIVRFRELARAYRAGGVSWWSWQDAGAADWRALSQGTGVTPHAVAEPAMAAVGDGARGDLVVWIQEHLDSAHDAVDVEVSGVFGLRTELAVEAFQSAHRLIPDGIVGPATWQALLRYRPLAVRWVHRGRRTLAADDAVASATWAVRRGVPVTLPVPASAALRGRAAEIPAIGAGGHSGR